MTARPTADSQQPSYEVAVVGNDMLLAALPGRPVQLAHALQAAGFDLVVPVSWGEEVIADHAARMLVQMGPGTVVFCSCPRVRQRLTQAGNELAPHLMSTVAPPVATARYLRTLHPGVSLRITYLGACEGARDSSIDVQVAPLDYLGHLKQRGISIVAQPTVFDAVIPPDRRRHWSLPGGIPTRSALKERGCAHQVTVLTDQDVAVQIADHLLLGEAALIDLAPLMGCACTGSIKVHQTTASREALAALEPPRSALPVIESDVRVQVELAIPHLTSSSAGVARSPLSLEGRSAKPDATASAAAPLGLPAVATAESRPSAPRPVARPRIAVTPSSIPRVDAHEHREHAAPREDTPPGTPTPIALRMLTSPPMPAPTGDTSSPAARRRTPTHGMHHIARQAAGIRLNASGGEVTRAYAALRGRRSSPEGGSPPGESANESPAVPPEEGGRAEQGSVDDRSHQHSTSAANPEEVAGELMASTEMATQAPAVDAVVHPGSAPVDDAKQPTGVQADAVVSSPPHAGETRSGPAPGARPRRAESGRPGTRRRLWGLLASVIAIAALTVLLRLVLSP